MATSKKQEAPKNEVAIPQNSAVAMFSDDVPEYLKTAMGGRGSEEVSTKDMVLPRMEIVQSQSPIKDDPDQDAKEGQLFNSATGLVIGDLAYFIPVYFRGEYLVWKDQDEGGGFFGSFPTQGEAENRVRELVADGENREFLEVVDTPVHYGLMVTPEGGSEQIVISMPKSKAKVSRKWNAMIQITGQDRFARVYKISTFKDKNKKNQAFYNFTVQPAGYPSAQLFAEAEKTYGAFKAQGVRADFETGTMDMEQPTGEGTERGEI